MAPEKKSSATNGTALHVTSIVSDQDLHAIVDYDYADDAASDDKILGALGYKQEFNRDFTIWESFSVSFSILGVLPSVASTFAISLGYVGTGGAAAGWLIAATLIQFTALALAEICSSIPTAGGLYYAAAVLAPEGWGPFFSWLVGYSNTIAFGVGPCSITFALAYMLTTAGSIAYPTYVPQTWHTYLILLGLLVLEGILSMQTTKFVGQVQKIGTVINVVVVIIFIIWLPVGSISNPKTKPSSQVWSDWTNGTEWPVGWATIMSFATVCFTMAGFDTSVHMSEETKMSPIVAPRSILMTAQCGMWMGWAVILVIAYTVTDVTDVVSGQYGQPFGSLCLQVLGSKAGLGLFSLNMIAQFFCGHGVTVVASRIVFAFARDGALPAHRWLAHVNGKTKTPVNATLAILICSAVIGLLMFAGPVAIGAVFNIAALGQYTSFTIPIALKLFDRHRFRPGPWNLGRWSRPVGTVAVSFWLVIVPAFCFPAAKGADLNVLNMNWTVCVYGGILALALFWYAVSARRWFHGPKINLEYANHTDRDMPKSE